MATLQEWLANLACEEAFEIMECAGFDSLAFLRTCDEDEAKMLSHILSHLKPAKRARILKHVRLLRLGTKDAQNVPYPPAEAVNGHTGNDCDLAFGRRAGRGESHRGSSPGERASLAVAPREVYSGESLGLQSGMASQPSSTAKAGCLITQARLRELVQKMQAKELHFVKNQPIAVLLLSGDKSESLPEKIVRILGAVDKATYGETPAKVREFLSTQAGGAIALQFSGDDPDFYPISPGVFSSQYVRVPATEIPDKNSKLHGKLAGYFGTEYVIDVPNISGALKTTAVSMVKVSDLGYNPLDEFVIEAPWGGSQEKVIGKDAFVVIERKENGNSFYLCNSDAEGLPNGYVTCDHMENVKQMRGDSLPYSISDARSDSRRISHEHGARPEETSLRPSLGEAQFDTPSKAPDESNLRASLNDQPAAKLEPPQLFNEPGLHASLGEPFAAPPNIKDTVPARVAAAFPDLAADNVP